MIVAHAALCNEVAIVLKHVEVVVADDAVDFGGEIAMDGGNAEVDGLAFELFGLPVRREIGDEPVWRLLRTLRAPGSVSSAAWVQSTQRPKRRPWACAASARGGRPCGNFMGSGYQVADAAEPAGVDVKHFKAELFESWIMRRASASSTCMPLPQLLLTVRG